jgi:hypothetical protein
LCRLTQYTHAGKVVLAELTPETFVEATHSVVCISGALAVGDAVEEVAVVGSLLPHTLHLSTARLEVAKVLLAQTGLLVDLDVGAAEGRRFGVVRGQRGEDALGGLAGTTVGRGEEVEGIVRSQDLPQTTSSVVGLGPAIVGKLYAVVGDCLVNLAVLCGGRE